MHYMSSHRQTRLPVILQWIAGSALFISCSGISALISTQDEANTEKAVHLLQEPRHRTVMRDGGVFLLDIQINPGDATYPHTHNQPILYTRISDENGPLDGEVVAQTEYASKPLTHVVANPGPHMIHILALVNDNPAVDSDQDDAPTGLSQEPEIENRWFRSYRIELQPGESTQTLTHKNTAAIILGKGELVHVSREDGITKELEQPGDWAWRQADSPYVISNQGTLPSIVVINESRRRRN